MSQLLKDAGISIEALQLISAEGAKNENTQTILNWLLLAKIIEEIADFDTHYCEL